MFGIVAVCATVSGCDVLFDHALDCIDDDRPRLSPSVIANPILNQEYRQVIQASIENEPRDDRFGYEFTRDGALPDGLASQVSGRNYIIEGTPIELGVFNFELTVVVDDPNADTESGSGLCSNIERVNYTLDIQMM